MSLLICSLGGILQPTWLPYFSCSICSEGEVVLELVGGGEGGFVFPSKGLGAWMFQMLYIQRLLVSARWGRVSQHSVG